MRCGGGRGGPDYEALLQQARAARRQDGERLKKVMRLSKKGKLLQERGLLRAHKEVWEKERARLLADKNEVEEEVERWRVHVGSSRTQFWRDFLTEAAAQEAKFSEERKEFFDGTIQPLWTLKCKLKAAVKEGKMEEGYWQSLCDELREVKGHHHRVCELMREEFDLLWTEVTTVCVPEDGERETVRGIPLELSAEGEGVGEGGYETALKQLQLLDEHYENGTRVLYHQHEERLSLQDGGWSSHDAERFHHIMGQYPTTLPWRRTLLIDRLMREFPHKTRSDIVSHEAWYCAVSYYRRQRAALMKSWRHHRTDLVCQLVAVLREQKQLLEAQALTATARAEQRKRTEELYQKVCVWQEEKRAALLQQEAEWAKERERQVAEREKEEQKMAAHRERVKAKLAVYHCQRQRERERERDEVEQRRLEREREREDEGRRGRERIEHRQQLLRERQKKEQEGREKTMKAIQERERRLENLRKQVEVNAVRDPQRVLKATKATKMRLWTTTELDPQHPLFTLHGYHDDIVTSDPRFRVAAAFKEAGLLDSEYARHILASIPPSHNPRPDQYSSIFKN